VIDMLVQSVILGCVGSVGATISILIYRMITGT